TPTAGATSRNAFRLKPFTEAPQSLLSRTVLKSLQALYSIAFARSPCRVLEPLKNGNRNSCSVIFIATALKTVEAGRMMVKEPNEDREALDQADCTKDKNKVLNTSRKNSLATPIDLRAAGATRCRPLGPAGKTR
ncbi:MAG TPA: hypothetical protein VGC26_08385, partial [Afipia sp.]